MMSDTTDDMTDTDPDFVTTPDGQPVVPEPSDSETGETAKEEK